MGRVCTGAGSLRHPCDVDLFHLLGPIDKSEIELQRNSIVTLYKWWLSIFLHCYWRAANRNQSKCHTWQPCVCSKTVRGWMLSNRNFDSVYLPGGVSCKVKTSQKLRNEARRKDRSTISVLSQSEVSLSIHVPVSSLEWPPRKNTLRHEK